MNVGQAPAESNTKRLGMFHAVLLSAFIYCGNDEAVRQIGILLSHLVQTLIASIN